jgi:hypothetical protein
VARGWGTRSLWLLPIAPWYVHGVGIGPITVPAHTRWSDGQPVTPAVSTDDPVDSGPITSSLALLGQQGECDVPANPRAASCPP